jgi:hypothetical protein
MNLSLLKIMGESVAKDYSINWENWTEEETAKTEKTTKLSLLFYERLFNHFDVDNEEHTIEIFNHILENLVSGYALQSIIKRKRAVERLLSGS